MWIVDNARNLRVYPLSFQQQLTLSSVHSIYKTIMFDLVDYMKDPLEKGPWESWLGVEALVKRGAEGKFGRVTAEFLRAALERQKYMKKEIIRRYNMHSASIPF